jgi:hypothetical protein
MEGGNGITRNQAPGVVSYLIAPRCVPQAGPNTLTAKPTEPTWNLFEESPKTSTSPLATSQLYPLHGICYWKQR